MTITTINKLTTIISAGIILSMFQNCSKVNFAPSDAVQTDKSAIAIDTDGGIIPVEAVVPVTPTSTSTTTPKTPTGNTTGNTPSITPVTGGPEEVAWEQENCNVDKSLYQDQEDSKTASKQHEFDDEDINTQIERDDLKYFMRAWNWGHFKKKSVFDKCLKIRLARFCKVKIDDYEQFIDIAQLAQKDAKELIVMNGKILIYSSDKDYFLDTLKIGEAAHFVGLCHTKVKNCSGNDKKKLNVM